MDDKNLKGTQLRDLDFELWVLIRQTSTALFRARQRELKPYGVLPRQAAVLQAICSIGKKSTPSKVSRWVFREPHTVSSMLNTMQKEGLITKTRDLEKRNLVRISLTPKGKEIHRQARKRKDVHNIIGHLSQEQRQQLKSALNVIIDEAIKRAGISHKRDFPPVEG